MVEDGFARHKTKTVVLVVDGKTLDFIYADDARAHRFF